MLIYGRVEEWMFSDVSDAISKIAAGGGYGSPNSLGDGYGDGADQYHIVDEAGGGWGYGTYGDLFDIFGDTVMTGDGFYWKIHEDFASDLEALGAVWK